VRVRAIWCRAAASNIRFGPGVTREVGLDLVNLGVKNVLLVTDPNIATLPAVRSEARLCTRGCCCCAAGRVITHALTPAVPKSGGVHGDGGREV